MDKFFGRGCLSPAIWRRMKGECNHQIVGSGLKLGNLKGGAGREGCFFTRSDHNETRSPINSAALLNLKRTYLCLKETEAARCILFLLMRKKNKTKFQSPFYGNSEAAMKWARLAKFHNQQTNQRVPLKRYGVQIELPPSFNFGKYIGVSFFCGKSQKIFGGNSTFFSVVPFPSC